VTLRAGVGVLALSALAGCATRADLVRQDRQLRGVVQEQRKQLQAVQQEMERLRGEVEEGGGARPGRASAGGEDRLTLLERRVEHLERELEIRPGSPEVPPETTQSGEPEPTPPAVASTPPPVARPPVEDDPWRREVAGEQASAGTVNVPERGEYLGLLDGLARRDCTRSVPQLNTFAVNHKDSALADNALYWAARCYALSGEQNQAISKFYDVVTRYPKGDKAPAALWAQGNLFVELGDSPDARLAFSKLIRDYPASDEAARARQKLSELEN
jgi:TolA-binding protein